MPNPLQERDHAKSTPRKLVRWACLDRAHTDLQSSPDVPGLGGGPLHWSEHSGHLEPSDHVTKQLMSGFRGDPALLKDWSFSRRTALPQCASIYVFHWCRWPLTQTSDAPSGRAICFHQRARWKLEIMPNPLQENWWDEPVWTELTRTCNVPTCPALAADLWSSRKIKSNATKHCGIHAVCHSSQFWKTLRGNRPCR